jgi:PAS domain S-box-containing protein
MDALLNTAPCGFVSFIDDGTMVDVNATLAQILGYESRVELHGWHLQKILAPGTRVFYHTHVFPMLKLHGLVEEIYLALRTKNGDDVPMLMNAARRERNGVIVNDCILMRMLQRNRFEEELLQARRAAEQANAAKAKFLSMMSHDLRTPLTSISGNADLLAAGVHGPLSEEQRDALTRMKEAVREQLRMINDILSFAQLDSGRVEVQPVPVRVADALTRAERLVRESVAAAGLSLDLDPAGAIVNADPDRFQQILLNLLTNATKFTPAGGRISVQSEVDGQRVRIRVRDTGVGIPRDQLEHIFDPFVQLEQGAVEPAHRGVGLGLAIARDLARSMNGELTADSTPDQGSVFTLELPAAAVAESPAPPFALPA